MLIFLFQRTRYDIGESFLKKYKHLVLRSILELFFSNSIITFFLNRSHCSMLQLLFSLNTHKKCVQGRLVDISDIILVILFLFFLFFWKNMSRFSCILISDFLLFFFFSKNKRYMFRMKLFTERKTITYSLEEILYKYST